MVSSGCGTLAQLNSRRDVQAAPPRGAIVWRPLSAASRRRRCLPVVARRRRLSHHTPVHHWLQATTGEAFAIALAIYAAVCLGILLAFTWCGICARYGSHMTCRCSVPPPPPPLQNNNKCYNSTPPATC